jgi:hypothetical protein
MSKSREQENKTVAVLVFTTHGDIQVQNPRNPELTEEVEKFTIPHEMEIVSLNAVSPGVPNLLPAKNVSPFVRIVRDATSSFNDETTKEDMKKMVEEIKDKLKEADTQPFEVEKEVRVNNEIYTGDEEIMAYHYRSRDFLYTIRTYTNGQIPNKEFLREDYLIYNKDNTIKSKSLNWKLNLLKKKGVSSDEDLMGTLNPIASKTRYSHLRHDFTVTRLKNVIDELYDRGIRKVIIIDLTCSVIRKKQAGVTAREERHIAFQTYREETPKTPNSVESNTKSTRGGKRINKTRKRYKK